MRTETLGFGTVVFGLVLALSLVPVGGWAQTGTGAFAQLEAGNGPPDTVPRASLAAC